jgi:hypothetical protein
MQKKKTAMKTKWGEKINEANDKNFWEELIA